jgi:glycosyltransferase involved in cell wall biosynthesis
MHSTPLVSIGLFVYNGDRFLEAAIESILNQTFKDFELIISDNCSTDRSEEICRRYAEQDSRIRYYRADRNRGAGWNLRNVYFKATGKYFKWAAHDDMIQLDFLRLCVDALEADDSLVVAHSLTRVIDEQGQFVENYEWHFRTESPDPVVRFKDLLLNDHLCYQIFGVMRMSALKTLPPQGSYVNSDGVLLAQMGLIGRFCEIPEFLFMATRHSKQSTQVKPVRLKAPRFRLTNRHGTLPGPEWWDPNKTTSITFPEWRMLREYFLTITQAPVTPWQRLRCYLLLLPWLWKHFRRMGKDLLIAADQVLFRLQTRGTKVTIESATSLDVVS